MTVPDPDFETSWILAARLLRPQGRRGEILAELEVAAEVFTAGRRLWLVTNPDVPPTPSAERTLESAWTPTGRNAGRIVLKLTGTDSISDAELLGGQLLLLPLADLPPLEADTFRVRDLIGCTLVNGSDPVGTIVEIQFPVGPDGRTRLTDAPDLLVVELTGQTDPDDAVLVPFAQAWLDHVDIAARRIVMHLPEGLLTTPDDDEPES